MIGIPVAACFEADLVVAEITAEPGAAGTDTTGTSTSGIGLTGTDFTGTDSTGLNGNSPYSLTVTAVISNTSSVAVPAGMPVGFYIDEVLVKTVVMQQELLPGTAQPVSIAWPVESQGDYNLKVVPNDPETFNLRSPPAGFEKTVSVRDMTLRAGWNLLSPILSPLVTDIAVVQRPVSGRYRQIVGYNGELLSYDPSAPPEANTLQRMDGGHGYWIEVLPAETSPTATLRLVGNLIAVDQPLPLTEGWNLVGYLPRETLTITDALASIAGKYNAVLGFSGTAESYYPVSRPNL